MATKLTKAQLDQLTWLSAQIDEYLACYEPKLYEELSVYDNKRLARSDFAVQRKFKEIIEPLRFVTLTAEDKKEAAYWFTFFNSRRLSRQKSLREGLGSKRTANELALLTVIILTWVEYVTE